jgi:hypothetical protein
MDRMKSSNRGYRSIVDHGLSHLVAALGARTEFSARFERPRERLPEDSARERRRFKREAAARKDFERAWKTY